MSVITLLLLVAGCGGGDDEASAASKASDGSSGSAQEQGEVLVATFPDDVPLPEGEIHSSTEVGDVGWRTMIVVDLEAEVESLKAEYTTLYEDAGFSVVQEGTVYNMTAENDEWQIDLVVRPPTITVQVLDQAD